MADVGTFQTAHHATVGSSRSADAEDSSEGIADSDVLAAIPLVRGIVRRLAGRVPATVDRDELYAAGLLGLVQARQTYRPGHGVPFDVHARARVTGAILDDLRHRDVMSRSQRASARVVISAMRTMAAPREPAGVGARLDQIASLAGLAPGEVRHALDNIDRANRWRRSVTVGDAAVADRLAAGGPDPAEVVLEQELTTRLRDGVERLPPRLRTVIDAVYFAERRTQDVAAELGVTPSRVSQMCGEAIRHLQADLRLGDEPRPANRPIGAGAR